MAVPTPTAIINAYHNNLRDNFSVQVISLNAHSDKNVAKLVVSDGKYTMDAILGAGAKAVADSLKPFAIIHIKSCSIQPVDGKGMVMVINSADFVEQRDAQIGTPSAVESYIPPKKSYNPTSSSTQRGDSPPLSSQPFSLTPPLGLGGGNLMDECQPISSLNPYQNKWTIKARVTKKTDIKDWKRERDGKAGKLFSVDLLDQQQGQIRATIFNDAVDKYYSVLTEGKVYIISKGNLKMANRKFNMVPNDYEMTLSEESEIIPVGEDAKIEMMKWNFVHLDQLISKAADDYIDVIGIVTHVDSLKSIATKSKPAKQLSKRTIILSDQTLSSVDLTLWGEQAEIYNEDKLKDNPVFAAKAVRVSSYGTCTLNGGFGTQIVLNPDKPENATATLQAWWAKTGKNATFVSVSKHVARTDAPRKALSAIHLENLGKKKEGFTSSGAKQPDGESISTRATVIFIRHDFDKPVWYEACPAMKVAGLSQKCGKKMTPESDGVNWNCEMHDRTPKPDIRYMLSVLLCDETGSQWVTAFNEIGAELLGKTAEDLKLIHEAGDKKAYDQVFNHANFKSFVWTLRVKREPPQAGRSTQGDAVETVRVHLMRHSFLDFRAESQLLLDALDPPVAKSV